MFGFIKRWIERRRRKTILKDIKKAQYIYLIGKNPFMCNCFMLVNFDKYGSYEKIRQRIPEFKPQTFNVGQPNVYAHWWHPRDSESRIKAFDKLIEIYSK